MNTDLLVFGTREPDVIATYKKTFEENNDWHRRIRDFAVSVHPEAKPMVSTAWGQERLGGLSVVHPVPEGWRVKSQRNGLPNLMTPRLSTKTGKAIAKEIEAIVKAPDVRAALKGMSSGAMHNLSYLSPGIELRGDVLYVTWSIHPDEADTGWSKGATKVDTSIWERVKLSEYYARKEAEERV